MAAKKGEIFVLRFFQAMMPREEKFFGLFNAHARTLVDGAIALRVRKDNRLPSPYRRVLRPKESLHHLSKK